MYINIHSHGKYNKHNDISLINLGLDSINESMELPPFFSLGIHPKCINRSTPEDLQRLKSFASHPGFLAIGECGLDKINGPHFDLQLEIFKAHIQLSETLSKPLIIHCVRAYGELIKLRKDIKPNQAWLFHGFNAVPEIMQQALKHGFYFSFGSMLLKEKSKAVANLKTVPHTRFFLETDADESMSIENIYKRSAELLNIKLPQLQELIITNFKHLFNV